MKIKRKVEMNLPQLIEWAKENDIKDTVFLTKSYSVGFDMHGFIYFNSSTTIPLDTTFTVEVEEEITEDTQIPNLRHLTEYGFTNITRARSIDDCKNDYSVAFYIINDDYTITLIWTKDKGLVE